jgi:hypothetical protein
MSDVILFRSKFHSARLAERIIATERRLLAEDMEADFRRTCREREEQRREAREAFDSMCGDPMAQLESLFSGLKGEK